MSQFHRRLLKIAAEVKARDPEALVFPIRSKRHRIRSIGWVLTSPDVPDQGQGSADFTVQIGGIAE